MTRWVNEKRECFERDILQGFCLFCRDMNEQFFRFAGTGVISSSALHGLVGSAFAKGPLWRLKDTAHLIFRDAEEYNSTGHLLDWTLGYIYHETVKLMEDAHLRQAYIARLGDLAGNNPSVRPDAVTEGLAAIEARSRGSAARAVEQLQGLIALSRTLFCRYFSGMAGHRPLARFLYDQEALARAAFKEEYQALLHEVYASEPERLYTEAACSLMDSARYEEAAKAVNIALALDPANESALRIRERLEAFGPAA